MKITINFRNTKHEIEIDPSKTVADFKHEIEKIIPELANTSMRLVHSAKFLKEDDKKIEELNLPKDCVIYVFSQQAAKKDAEPVNEIPEQQSRDTQGMFNARQPNLNMNDTATMRNTMRAQMKYISDNPDMMDAFLGTQLADRSPQEKENIKNMLLEQIRTMDEHPEMYDAIVGKFFSGDSNAMANILKSAESGGLFGQPGGMFAAPRVMPGDAVAQVAPQQEFIGGTQPSPTIPCSHGYYPYGYIGPKIVFQPVMSQPTVPQEKPMTKEEIEAKYKTEILTIEEMGFENRSLILQALQEAKGNVDRAIDLLLQWESGANK